MNEPDPLSDVDRRAARPVFISYATADRKQALSICEAIERRGIDCWLSSRDVEPGDNYQEAIVQSIRSAPAIVLIFSKAANNSDEIKKELSLASRYRVPVMAIRIEDVEPSDAFAYELATRQWIDAFTNVDRSLDTLVGRIRRLATPTTDASSEGAPTARRSNPRQRGGSGTGKKLKIAGIAATMLLLIGAGAAWWGIRRDEPPEHAMTVRLAGFQLLSPDLPPALRDAVSAEISAAFNADGVVGVSTASAPPAGTSPAYALGGTIQRSEDGIRVIPRLTEERSGATLWSGTFDYEKDLARVPRHIAVDAGNIVRCGLFGASTYRQPLPNNVMRDYMQFCQAYWNPDMREGRNALVPAERVVAAVPKFSWGWAAVAGAYWKLAMGADDPRQLADARRVGQAAADRAVSIDPRNSEALYIHAMLLDGRDWLTRGRFLQRAVEAQRLDCGCERHQYGDFLINVGRVSDGVDQLRQANQMLALYVYTPLSLADGLVIAGNGEEAKHFYSAAADLAPTAEFSRDINLTAAVETGDLKALADRKLPISADERAALLKAYRALGSPDAGIKADAARDLRALPADQQSAVVARLLAGLGAQREAFLVAQRLLTTRQAGPSILWHAQMRPVLDQPGMPALLGQLGLLDYWKKSNSRPDVCGTSRRPSFCSAI